MAEKRILLADADAETVAAFRNALGPPWELTTVASGQAALAELKKQRYEVLLADLELPEINGTELLNEARQHYPNTIRFILAADEQKERVMKHMVGAHQFLAKPFNFASLASVLERSVSLDNWIGDRKLRELVSRIRSFPILPSLYLEVLAALRSPDSTTEQVGAIVSKDMAMMTKLLQVLNSAYFSLPRRITDPAEAVGFLGFETVKSLVITIKLLNQFDQLKPVYFSIDRIWRHSMEVAQYAKQLVIEQTGDRAAAAAAYTAGLMHDLGKVVLAANFDEQYQGIHSLARKQQLPLWEVEKEIFGASHGEIGAYLFGLWGMPLEVQEVAALHHHPSRSLDKDFTCLTAVHVANALEQEGSAEPDGLVVPAIEEEYLARIGLRDCLAMWRASVADWDANAAKQESTKSKPLAGGRSNVVDGTKSEIASGTTTTAHPRQSDTDVAQPAAIPASISSETNGETERPGLPEPTQTLPSGVPNGLGPLVKGWLSLHRRWVYAGVCVAVFGLVFAWLMTGPLRREAKTPLLTAETQTSTQQNASTAETGTAVAGHEPTVHTPQITPDTMVKRETGDTPKPSWPAKLPEGGPDTAALVKTAVMPPLTNPGTNDMGLANLKLQGIIYSTAHPMALINGRTIGIGERLAGAVVLEITQSSVTLQYPNGRKTLILKM